MTTSSGRKWKCKMRIRIVEHYDKENGHFLGYEIQYKLFWFCPFWRTIDGMPWLKDKQSLEHDIFFLLSIHGLIKTKDEFH